MKFSLLKTSIDCDARAGSVTTDHGTIETPIFMPVGTQASVKAISPEDLDQIGAQIILNNTYHLYLRPGPGLIRKAGGVQKFSSWNKPILTDSGGYQVFSLSDFNKISEQGFEFRSHLDGSAHLLTPEHVVEIQRDLGSDIMMVLDECVPYPCDYDYARKAHELTVRWAGKSLNAFKKSTSPHDFEQSLFAIVQGSVYTELRQASANALLELDFPGYAIGGLSVGEPKSAMVEMTHVCTEILPKEKPRYLMGVGKPEDIVEAIERGVDMFDCILPTRNGRNGTVFTSHGKVNIKNARYKDDFGPLDANCECYTCTRFTRSYLRHLYNAKELLVLRLLSYHNLYFYLRLVNQARQAILDDRYLAWKKEFYNHYHQDTSIS
jgi:queuine tRNA-ribosyltransferase